MIRRILKILKRFLFMFLLIYSYNVFVSPIDLLIPINLITILYVGFFGIPAFFSIIFLNFMIY